MPLSGQKRVLDKRRTLRTERRQKEKRTHRGGTEESVLVRLFELWVKEKNRFFENQPFK